MRTSGIAGLLGVLLLSTPGVAQVGFKATPILQSGVTIQDAPIAYPETDSPEITALLVEIEPGGESGRHKHPNPTFVYVLEGALEVEMDGGSHSFKAGDSFLEAVDTWHNGRNKGDVPAKILVVFSGAAGTPNLIRPE